MSRHSRTHTHTATGVCGVVLTVGAQRRRFSSDWRAVLHRRLWMRLRLW